MKEIKEKLSEKYLKMEDYFNLSFEVFKKVIMENRLITVIYFILLLVSNYSAKEIQSVLDMADQSMNTYFPEELLWMSPVYFIIFFSVSVIHKILIKKFVMKIEGKNNFNLIDIIKKIFKLFVAGMLINLAFTITGIFMSIVFIPLLKLDNKILVIIFIIFAILISIVLIVAIIWFILSMLYFDPLYFSRKVGLREAFIYNRHLCRGNRLRKLIPSIIIFLFLYLIGMTLGFLNILSYYKILFFPLLIIQALFSIVSIFYTTSLSVVIYLNVEYMDLKKYNEPGNEDIF